MKVKGIGAKLVVGADGVEIVRNAMSFGGRSNKKFYYDQITAVQFRSASFFSNGYIQFTVPGGMEKKGGSMRAVFDENSVAFGFSSRKAFLQARNLIDSHMDASHRQTSSATTTTNTDELERLAALVDRGFITRDEFDAKKRQLLNL